jgi:hypothetical protein
MSRERGARLSDIVGAMHLMVFTLLVGCALAGRLKVRARTFVVSLVAGVVGFSVCIGALLVPDHRRKDFASRNTINALGPIRLGLVGEPRISRRFEAQFDGIELVPLDSDQEYFDGERNGMTQELYDYWILGKGAVETRPRWSIVRDVLHWVD